MPFLDQAWRDVSTATALRARYAYSQLDPAELPWAGAEDPIASLVIDCVKTMDSNKVSQVAFHFRSDELRDQLRDHRDRKREDSRTFSTVFVAYAAFGALIAGALVTTDSTTLATAAECFLIVASGLALLMKRSILYALLQIMTTRAHDIYSRLNQSRTQHATTQPVAADSATAQPMQPARGEGG
eukprot:3086038-Prymnesium_polylepis.1